MVLLCASKLYDFVMFNTFKFRLALVFGMQFAEFTIKLFIVL